MENKKFNIYEGCVPVRGYARSIIYDLQREDYDFIPNELMDFILENKENTIRNVKNEEIINNYLEFLIEKEYAFFCEENELELFPPISFEWDFPSHLVSTVVDIGNGWSNERMDTFLEQMSKVNCQHIQIFTTHPHKLDIFNAFLKRIYNSSIRSIELLMPYYHSINENDVIKLLNKNKRICNLIMFNAPENKIFENIRQYIFISEDLDIRGCNDLGYFQVNLLMFSEAKKYNTFFNRKVFIDEDGNIKNDPLQVEYSGNIENKNLLQVIQDVSFQELWSAQKDEIDTCRDCEFRYMCIDSRVPKKRLNGTWFYEKECNYNPYIAKWKGEKGYKSLSDCGIIVNEKSQSIDFFKIDNILSNLYQ
jgi:SPASM domain peptide maturase of grasp-with-spasm system